jgi:hypothetical protein
MNVTPNASPETAEARRGSWRNRYRVHEATALFPMMTEDALAELAEDIEEHGLRHPIVLWRDPDVGREDDEPWLIDGRNRLDALNRATGIELQPENEVEMKGDPVALVMSLNLVRRHLNAEQKRALVREIIKRRPEWSNRRIATNAGVDHKTVSAARKQAESSGEIPHFDKTVGSDGKARPTKRAGSQQKAPDLMQKLHPPAQESTPGSQTDESDRHPTPSRPTPQDEQTPPEVDPESNPSSPKAHPKAAADRPI